MSKHRALPVFRRGNRLFLGVSDPTNHRALDEIGFTTGMVTNMALVEEAKLAPHGGITQTFDELVCNLVAAGEQAGVLDLLLDKIATYKEKTESIKGKIKKALVYPMAVILVAILVTAAIMLFVIPQFEALFTSFGADLPAFTRLVRPSGNAGPGSGKSSSQAPPHGTCPCTKQPSPASPVPW